jgi:hypothetical protein
MRASDCAKLILLLSGALIPSAFADPSSGSGQPNSNGPPGTTSSSQNVPGSNMYYQPSVEKTGAPNDHGEGMQGAPISGPQRHEKVFEVDSLQKLPSSGVDLKFKGSLLDNSIDSIQSLNPNAKKNSQPENTRFSSVKELKVTGDAGADKSKKEPRRTEASPSPSPSPTASPTAKPSDGSNR